MVTEIGQLAVIRWQIEFCGLNKVWSFAHRSHLCCIKPELICSIRSFFFFFYLCCVQALQGTVYRQWKHGHLLLKLTLLNINLLGRQLMVQRSESETATERAYVQLVNWSVRATRSIPPTAQRDPARAPNFDPTFIDTEATNSYIIDSKLTEAKQDRRCTRCFSFGMAAGLCELRSSTANQPHTHRRS